MSTQKVTIDQVIQNILDEQKSLKDKKQQVQELINKLSVGLKQLDQKSYRGMSHLTGEVIKSLVTAHDLDIKISNTLLRSYEQLARLLKEQEATEDVNYDLLTQLLGALGSEQLMESVEGGSNGK